MLAYLPRLGTLIEPEAELLLASSDVTVGFALDLGLLGFIGADPTAAIERCGDRLRLVRVQLVEESLAARARAEAWSFPRLAREGVFAPPEPDAPTLNAAAIGAALASADYRGWLVAAAERLSREDASPDTAAAAKEALDRIASSLEVDRARRVKDPS